MKRRIVAFALCVGAASLAILFASSTSHGQGSTGPDGDITAVRTGSSSGMEGGAERGVANLHLKGCGSGSALISTGSAGSAAWDCGVAGGSDGLGPDGNVGDATVSGSGTTLTINNAAVTLAKLADLAASRVLCRVTAGTGVPEACTGAQVAGMLPNASTSTTTPGLVPGSNSATTAFLRGDLTWQVISGLISGLTTNTIPKAGSGTTLTDSHVTDSGSLVTVTGPLSNTYATTGVVGATTTATISNTTTLDTTAALRKANGISVTNNAAVSAGTNALQAVGVDVSMSIADANTNSYARGVNIAVAKTGGGTGTAGIGANIATSGSAVSLIGADVAGSGSAGNTGDVRGTRSSATGSAANSYGAEFTNSATSTSSAFGARATISGSSGNAFLYYGAAAGGTAGNFGGNVTATAAGAANGEGFVATATASSTSGVLIGGDFNATGTISGSYAKGVNGVTSVTGAGTGYGGYFSCTNATTCYSIYGAAGVLYNLGNNILGSTSSNTTQINGVVTTQQFRGTTISPTAITGTTSNWNPTGLSTASTIRIATSAAATITGMQGCTDTRWMTWINISANDVTLSNQDGTETTATQRFLVTDGTSPVLHTDGVAIGNCDTTTGRWRIVYYTPAASTGKTWVYGDGSDGACNYDGTTTVAGAVPSVSVYSLDRDPLCTTITISTGIEVRPLGFRMFATGLVTITGTGKIDANGSPGGNGTSTAGAGGTGGGGPEILPRGNSGAVGAVGSGAPGNAASCSSLDGWPWGTTLTGGGGGSGNQAGSTATGGNTAVASSADNGSPRSSVNQALTYRSLGYTSLFTPSCGGSSGGGGWSATGPVSAGGGGGGGGGGVVVIAAPSFATSGSIEAKGGAGGNGGTNGGAVGGRGGGGTGGVVILVTSDTTLPTISVAGGAASTTGNGTATAGGSGYSFTFAPVGI